MLRWTSAKTSPVQRAVTSDGPTDMEARYGTRILIQASDKSAKLGDLMLAKALEGTLAQQITKPGELVGDVNYMSPERTTGDSKAVDHRSDLFSLGATVVTHDTPGAMARMFRSRPLCFRASIRRSISCRCSSSLRVRRSSATT